MKPLRAGQMRHRIEIYKLVRTRADSGAYTEDKQLIKTVNASIEYMEASVEGSVVRQNQRELVAVIRFNKNLYANLSSDCYITFRGIEYDVENAVNVDFADRQIQMDCVMRG